MSLARKAGLDDETLDEVRLAVGEACSRAVGVHQSKVPDAPVVMRLSDEQDNFGYIWQGTSAGQPGRLTTQLKLLVSRPKACEWISVVKLRRCKKCLVQWRLD